jgi:hypothetical protein
MPSRRGTLAPRRHPAAHQRKDLIMPWEPQRNRNSLSPHGIKAAEGHAPRGLHDTNRVGCPPMPDGILGAPLNADPHGAGPRMFTSSPKPAARATSRPQRQCRTTRTRIRIPRRPKSSRETLTCMSAIMSAATRRRMSAAKAGPSAGARASDGECRKYSHAAPHVQQAANVVDHWLKSVEQPPAPRRDLQREWAQRLDRARQFDQTKMPAWRDPRDPR